ncbi:MAG: pyridoxamine 5'-phosphate oxidase family protein [Coriobacteriia bacterium]|nr:pyridoxamine 5'-phosphate oxidase family protein [Coriobacteriia bacterium]
MRREQLEITEMHEIARIFSDGLVCHLAFNCKGRAPYIVAMNYAYEGAARTDASSSIAAPQAITLWFHSADSGRKLDLLKEDPLVAFQIETRVKLAKGSGLQACDWGMEYESIVGEGLLAMVRDPREKQHGLLQIIKHYGAEGLAFGDVMLAKTEVLRLSVQEYAAKRSSRLMPQIG